MKIYNSLSGKKEDFQPIKKGQVGMYLCGPTVYDLPHIGHARAAYIFEVIRNYLLHKGQKVRFVQNVTDLDDKIIAKAKSELPDMQMSRAVNKIAAKYTKVYYQDMDVLGIKRATFSPRATEHIQLMQKFIKRLIKNRYAYESDGNVYFDVRKYKDYGQLSHQDLKQMRSTAKMEKDQGKRDSLDFALWKKAKEGEPSWDSPWGRGRPGWHIECSAMSSKYLGDEFDIHAGGRDLIFPHHENEIAQSRCYSDKGFAKVWMHNGLLTINGQKMAKSLGNFVTIKDFINRGYQLDVLKLFFLQTHYSQPIDFSWERIKEKQEALYRITSFLKRLKIREKGQQYASSPDIKSITPRELKKKIKQARSDFEKSMDNDFNTPNAIAVLFEIVSDCNKAIYSDTFSKEYLPALKYAEKTIKELARIFGISFEKVSLPMPKEEIETKIRMREQLRKQRKFEEADQIRKQLAEKDIILEDTKQGTKWDTKS